MATSPTSCGSHARDGNRRVDAERHRREHGGTDDRAVDEVVERVADEHERHGASRRAPALVGVAMPKQHQLLEDEEVRDAASSVPNTAGGTAFSRASGSSASSRDAEQRADGVA